MQRSSASAISATVGCGIALYTARIAVSRRMPVGSPCSSRSITPPSGSTLVAVTPARCSATVFATATWPQARTTMTGCSGAAASRSARVGWRRSSNRASSYPRARIQRSVGCDAARSRILATSWLMLVVSSGRALTAAAAKPTFIGWQWASLNAAVAVRPRRSITSVPGRRSVRVSALLPTAAIIPLRIATASATGCAGSDVTIWPFVRMRSPPTRVRSLRYHRITRCRRIVPHRSGANAYFRSTDGNGIVALTPTIAREPTIPHLSPGTTIAGR